MVKRMVNTRAEKAAEEAQKREEKRRKADDAKRAKEEARRAKEEAKRAKEEGKHLQAMGFQDSKQLSKSRSLMQSFFVPRKTATPTRSASASNPPVSEGEGGWLARHPPPDPQFCSTAPESRTAAMDAVLPGVWQAPPPVEQLRVEALGGWKRAVRAPRIVGRLVFGLFYYCVVY